MNILMLNYEFPPIGGGASPVSYDIAKRLAEKGHFITVVTMAYKGLPLHETIDGIEIHRVKCLRTKKMVCHPWEQATYITSAVRFIKCRLDITKYDICYTHFIIPTGVVAWWINSKYKLPYVITSHGSDVIGHNNKRFKFLYAIVKKPWCSIVKKAQIVVAPSKYLEELMKKNEPNASYQVIQNGVDTTFFARTEKKQKKILIMCRLQETKNVQNIIRSLSLVDLGEWKVDIMGDGPYKDALQKLVSECNLGKYVRFQGWVTNRSEEHLKCLQDAGIYLSASKIENCPTSILEALSCGARVLLSDIPAHRQLMEKMDDDVFFKIDDDQGLARKLQKLISKADNEENMTNQYDITKYNWEACIDKYEKILLGCLRRQ